MIETYPKSVPPTIFWTIGWAKTGRIRLKLWSVLVGSDPCVYVRVVVYSPVGVAIKFSQCHERKPNNQIW